VIDRILQNTIQRHPKSVLLLGTRQVGKHEHNSDQQQTALQRHRARAL
jgi:hypothetical protein